MYVRTYINMPTEETTPKRYENEKLTENTHTHTRPMRKIEMQLESLQQVWERKVKLSSPRSHSHNPTQLNSIQFIFDFIRLEFLNRF